MGPATAGYWVLSPGTATWLIAFPPLKFACVCPMGAGAHCCVEACMYVRTYICVCLWGMSLCVHVHVWRCVCSSPYMTTVRTASGLRRMVG